MDNREKAIEIADLCHHCLDKDGNLCSICTKCKAKGIYYACVEMAEWKDSFYKPAMDLLIDFINDTQCDDISYDICCVDDDWCENNCGETNPNFNLNCLIKWLKIKGNNKIHEYNDR